MCRSGAGRPEGRRGGLLARVDLLMAALNADLSALGAELQGSGGRGEAQVRASAAEGSGDGPHA
ncbi:hypothetical protein [Streptomyces werraensis]|uniref:hypothetical protein n=1 Tax=Streptomyces werraensis TaxID=68284 RepID=UPI00369F7C79